MKPELLRRTILKTPFRPVRIRLDLGDPLLVTHPENIGITNVLVLVSEGPEAPYFFEPERVVAIEHPKGRKR